jgi:CHAT domain-containing protein
MESLYARRLEGYSTAEAVRLASLTSLELARERGRSDHPFGWGAFVASGDWR